MKNKYQGGSKKAWFYSFLFLSFLFWLWLNNLLAKRIKHAELPEGV